MSKLSQLLADTAYAFTLRPYIAYHRYVTDKYGVSVKEKFGDIPARVSANKCLLIHAVSVGEVIAAKTVIDEFSSRHPDWDIRISVSTATGRQVAIDKYGSERVSFYPLDVSKWTNRFFDNIKPDLIVLMELEVWPNFLDIANTRNVPVIVVNARITEKSAASYKKYNWFPLIKKMLSAPKLWLAQSDEYKDRLIDIGVDPKKISVSGSVKFDTVPTKINQDVSNKYRRLLGVENDEKIFLAGSTHPTEEEIVLTAYKEVLKNVPNTKLVLVPRHPHRIEEVESLATTYGSVTLRSKIEHSAASKIILVDTMGELANLYEAADVVFIGGSFIEHGGQNMLEPCGLAKATAIGPSYYNFKIATEALIENNGLLMVSNPDELGGIICQLLKDPQKSRQLGENARATLLKLKGATVKAVDTLENFIGEGN